MLYEYDTDADSYAGVGFSMDDDDEIANLHWNDSPVSAKWKARRCHGFDDNPAVVGDFPSVSNYSRIPVMTERAWNVLQPLIGGWCEALPIIHPSGKRHFIVHVMNTIDCLDRDKSQFDCTTDEQRRIYRINRYAFKESMLQGQQTFKLPHLSGSKVDCRRRLSKSC